MTRGARSRPGPVATRRDSGRVGCSTRGFAELSVTADDRKRREFPPPRPHPIPDFQPAEPTAAAFIGHEYERPPDDRRAPSLHMASQGHDSLPPSPRLPRQQARGPAEPSPVAGHRPPARGESLSALPARRQATPPERRSVETGPEHVTETTHRRESPRRQMPAKSPTRRSLDAGRVDAPDGNRAHAYGWNGFTAGLPKNSSASALLKVASEIVRVVSSLPSRKIVT